MMLRSPWSRCLLEVPHWSVAQPPSASTQPLRVLQQFTEMVGVSTFTTHITKAKKKKMLEGGPGLGPHHLSSPVTVGGPLQIPFQACLRTLITVS